MATTIHPALQQVDGRTWIFENDTRLVGELTPVTSASDHNTYLSGWVEIAAHDHIPDAKYVNGQRHEMRVNGPIYSHQNRQHILDIAPQFVRN